MRPTDYKIEQRIIHPNYKSPSMYHNIALFSRIRGRSIAIRESQNITQVTGNKDTRLVQVVRSNGLIFNIHNNVYK